MEAIPRRAGGVPGARPLRLRGAASAATLVVHVRDAAGGAIAGAEGRVTTGALATVAAAVTNEEGTFPLEGVPAGRYVLTVQASGFAVASLPIDVAPSGRPVGHRHARHRAAQRGRDGHGRGRRAEIASRSPQAVNVIPQDAIGQRTRTVVAQAVAEEAGVHLQRTSPTMAGIFVRGLTGNKVNVFVDGVRYSNGAQRGGVNTFLDLIEPSALDTIESCAARTARSTAATRSAAACSSCRCRRPVARRPAARHRAAAALSARHRRELRRRQRPRRLQPVALRGSRSTSPAGRR